MQRTTKFFVYGTLKQGECNFCVWPHKLVRVQPATIRGAKLYDLGGFPAMIEFDDANARVAGQLIEVADAHAAETLARLDRLEGYREGQPVDANHYIRRWVLVRQSNGLRLPCWAYFMTGKQAEDMVARMEPMEPNSDGVASWSRSRQAARA